MGFKSDKEVSISASTGNIEEVLEKIAIGEMKVEGRGYYNRTSGVFGIMLFIKDSPSETIDVFMETGNPQIAP